MVPCVDNLKGWETDQIACASGKSKKNLVGLAGLFHA